VRPFLSVTRATLESYARARRLAWIDDPSNGSRAYLRNRLRHEFLPALRRVRPTIDAELLELSRRASSLRRDVDAFIDANVELREFGAGRGVDVSAASFAELPAADAAVLWPAILARAGVVLDRRGTQRLSHFGASARVGARMQLRAGWQVVRSRDALQLRASDGDTFVAEATLTPLALSNLTRWGDGRGVGAWSFRALDASSGATESEWAAQSRDVWSAWLPTDRELSIRAWRAGDAMVVGAGRSPRKVKHLLSEAGVTGHQRSAWPVVLAGEHIVWVPGVRRGHISGASPGSVGLPFACDYFYGNVSNLSR
jgi:tRNA(Ile)-lysidine synthetase-like protein